MMKRKAEIYRHPPLVETVFEIRFPGEPAVECRRDEYFRLIRKDFPNVWVPNAEPGQPLALQPYHFKSADKAETVMVSINRFAYAARKYPGFGGFSTRALLLANQFCRRYRIGSLIRTGLRYVNVIPFVRQDGVIPWGRYFTIPLNLPASPSDEFLNASVAYVSRCDKGMLTVRIACAKSQDGVQEVFVLDFDFAKSEPLKASKLKRYLLESHDYTKRVFEGIIADDYKVVMRGEVAG